MAIRQRAIQAEDKQERHHAILDAAERLLLREPDRVASVAEVADEAGLAKGTVYLYFASKEELLLALHERNLEAFFAAFDTMVRRAPLVSLDDLITVTFEHIVRRPLFLPLAARCFALMAHSIPADVAAAYRQRMTTRLENAGAGVERLFPGVAPGEGVAKLRHSFALMIGLWQMSAASACSPEAAPSPSAARGGQPVALVFGWNYPDELGRALRSLWEPVVIAPQRTHARSGVRDGTHDVS
jgi:AcrR family transcriptional regulator